MSIYMGMIKHKHGYRSLKAKYYEQYPNLGGTGSSGLEMIEREDEDNTVPLNPIEEKDSEIANLKEALDASTKACIDITAVKSNLTKTKNELKSFKWTANLNKNKIDLARRVIEQSIDLCLSDSTLVDDKENELATLYSTLIDEEDFELGEEDTCSPKLDFLVENEKLVVDRGSKPKEMECLQSLKAKILDVVKNKKISRRSRKDSVGSQNSYKRGQKDQNGGDSSRAKLETK